MTDSRPNYDESIEALKQRGILGPDDSPPLQDKMPEPDDPDPLGLSFYRMGFENGADLSELTIPRTFFGRSEIENVSFRNTDLSESNLRWNDFIDVDLTAATLSNADLRASQYIRVNFTDADLSGADLRYSDYESCIFEAANMSGSLLAEDQREVLPLSKAQIDQIAWQPDHGSEPSGG